MKLELFAIFGFIPLMVGTHPVPATVSLTAHLCGGGRIEIPLGKGQTPPPAPCDMKGCHAGCHRKRFDRAQ